MTSPPPGAGAGRPARAVEPAPAGTPAPGVAANGAAPAPAPRPRPFLKWAGGKGQLLGELLSRIPPGTGTYFEPMVGGGALFFALAGSGERRPGGAVLSDANSELMAAYRVVRDRVGPLIRCLEVHAREYLEADGEGRRGYYYEVRAAEPADAVERAARMLFLNRTCYNGLYRVNRSGRFNVPHGRYARPRILDADALRSASRALAGVDLRSVDVADAVADAAAGDLVYLDPPFFPLSTTSSFTDYTTGKFGEAEQLQLRWLVDELTERGVLVMLSNSDTDWVRAAYATARYPAAGRTGGPGAEPERARHAIGYVPARRMINSRGDGRSEIRELILMNPPLVEALGRVDPD